MDRRTFLSALGVTMTAQTLGDAFAGLTSLPLSERMPVAFIGHGNPMNAIEDNAYSKSWKSLGTKLPKPKAILCVSAHWETSGTYVTAMEKPKTIHDFGGFPQALFDAQYPAPGSPEVAKETAKEVKKTNVGLDDKWGLDHGTWSVLLPMYPKADIPVLQLSLDYTKPPQYHYELAKELSKLRERGVLIIGSGNIVHNLRMMKWNGGNYDWAEEFDAVAKKHIASGDHKPLIEYEKLGNAAKLSIPTNEHYLPMLYILGLTAKNESPTFFNESVDLGSVSMRSFVVK
jgi:4,5-DOPA dioxygenase extradiol